MAPAYTCPLSPTPLPWLTTAVTLAPVLFFRYTTWVTNLKVFAVSLLSCRYVDHFRRLASFRELGLSSVRAERLFPNYPIQRAHVIPGYTPAHSLFSFNLYKSMCVLVSLCIYCLLLACKLQKSRFPVCLVCAVSPVPRIISWTYRRLVLLA